MKFQMMWMTIYFIALTTLGFNLLVEELNAQTKIVITQDKLDIPLGDRASYLQNLESRSASQWSFPTSNIEETSSSYELNIYNPDIKLTEQKPSAWGNTGDDPNYSVLVDIYEFDIDESTEETSN